LQDADRLKKLIKEFDQLDRQSGAYRTPQKRGQRFNQVVAEMFQCWGIDAEPSTLIPGVGEMDIAFTLDGQRYLAEAKWERKKTDITPMSKLRTRLRQRLRGDRRDDGASQVSSSVWTRLSGNYGCATDVDEAVLLAPLSLN
jgi:hypothetical protein